MVNASSSRLKLQKISAKAKLVAQASFYIQIHLEWSIALWAWDASHHGRVLPKQICHGVRPVAKHFSRYAHRIQPHQHPLLYHLATLPSTAPMGHASLSHMSHMYKTLSCARSSPDDRFLDFILM